VIHAIEHSDFNFISAIDDRKQTIWDFPTSWTGSGNTRNLDAGRRPD
jgi:hypothetical protein